MNHSSFSIMWMAGIMGNTWHHGTVWQWFSTDGLQTASSPLNFPTRPNWTRLDSKISDLQRLWLYMWFLFLTLWRIRLVKRGLCPEVKTDVWNVRLQVLPFFLCTILWRVHGDRVLLYLHEYLGKHNNQFEVLTFLQIPQIHIWSNTFVPDKQLLQILECLRMHLKGFGRSWT